MATWVPHLSTRYRSRGLLSSFYPKPTWRVPHAAHTRKRKCRVQSRANPSSVSWTDQLNKKLKNVSCEYDRLNGWNSTLQAVWYIRHVRIIWFLWTKRTWLLIPVLSFTQNIVRACSMFYPYEGYRSVTPLDAARVNRTIFHNHSVHWYYVTLIKGR